MATTPVIVNFKAFDSRRCNNVEWNLVGAETGIHVESSGLRDRSVQVTGSFAGNTVAIEGSNDGLSFFVLNNSAMTALSFTSANFQLILEPSRFLRARVTGGGASTIKINLFLGA